MSVNWAERTRRGERKRLILAPSPLCQRHCTVAESLEQLSICRSMPMSCSDRFTPRGMHSKLCRICNKFIPRSSYRASYEYQKSPLAFQSNSYNNKVHWFFLPHILFCDCSILTLVRLCNPIYAKSHAIHLLIREWLLSFDVDSS